MHLLIAKMSPLWELDMGDSMKTWVDYHFLSNQWPQTYTRFSGLPSSHPAWDDEIIVESLAEYMKMIRTRHPETTFKVVKYGRVGWEIKKELIE